jgi:hypothetical protein
MTLSGHLKFTSVNEYTYNQEYIHLTSVSNDIGSEDQPTVYYSTLYIIASVKMDLTRPDLVWTMAWG